MSYAGTIFFVLFVFYAVKSNLEKAEGPPQRSQRSQRNTAKQEDIRTSKFRLRRYAPRLICPVRFGEDEMEDRGISVNKHCPCTQPECPIFGNCVLCVQNHLAHKRHIPECIQNLLRPAVQDLVQQMELRTGEGRPAPDFWKTFDKQKHLAASLTRHKTTKSKRTTPAVRYGSRASA